MEFNWKAVVKTIAPSIASVFGTPLAGMGVAALLGALLPEGAPKPDDAQGFLEKALSVANPEVMLKLKDAEQKFKLDLKKLDIDLETTLAGFASKNTEGARELKKTWLALEKWDYEPVLAIGVCLAFGYAEFWVFMHATAGTAMDPGTSVLIGRVLGSVDSAFMLLLSFRWGSSRGSERKTEIAAIQSANDSASSGQSATK